MSRAATQEAAAHLPTPSAADLAAHYGLPSAPAPSTALTEDLPAVGVAARLEPLTVGELPDDPAQQLTWLEGVLRTEDADHRVGYDRSYVPSLHEFHELQKLAARIGPRQEQQYSHERGFTPVGPSYWGISGDRPIPEALARRIQTLADPRTWLQDKATERVFSEASIVASHPAPSFSEDGRGRRRQAAHDAGLVKLEAAVGQKGRRFVSDVGGLTHVTFDDTGRPRMAAVDRLLVLNRAARQEIHDRGEDPDVLVRQLLLEQSGRSSTVYGARTSHSDVPAADRKARRLSREGHQADPQALAIGRAQVRGRGQYAEAIKGQGPDRDNILLRGLLLTRLTDGGRHAVRTPDEVALALFPDYANAVAGTSAGSRGKMAPTRANRQWHQQRREQYQLSPGDQEDVRRLSELLSEVDDMEWYAAERTRSMLENVTYHNAIESYDQYPATVLMRPRDREDIVWDLFQTTPDNLSPEQQSTLSVVLQCLETVREREIDRYRTRLKIGSLAGTSALAGSGLYASEHPDYAQDASGDWVRVQTVTPDSQEWVLERIGPNTDPEIAETWGPYKLQWATVAGQPNQFSWLARARTIASRIGLIADNAGAQIRTVLAQRHSGGTEPSAADWEWADRQAGQVRRLGQMAAVAVTSAGGTVYRSSGAGAGTVYQSAYTGRA